MSKEEALKKLDELQAEEAQLKAEEENIKHVESLAVSRDSSRAEEVRCRCARMWSHLHDRIHDWCRRMQEFEQQCMLMPGYTS